MSRHSETDAGTYGEVEEECRNTLLRVAARAVLEGAEDMRLRCASFTIEPSGDAVEASRFGQGQSKDF